jgi:hypothetical protein
MKNTLSLRTRDLARLQALKGKTISEVIWHNSHGDVLDIRFTSGEKLCACTFRGTETKYTDADGNDLYVSLNGEEL